MAITEQDRSQVVQEGEPALIEESRRLLIAHGLLSRDQALTPLPNDPVSRRHNNGSEAVYLVEQEVGPSVVYVSTLAPGSSTSRHSHPGRGEEHKVFESYVCVHGEVTLILNNREEKILREGQKYQVWPGVLHQAKTNGRPAVLAIVMENGAMYPRDKRHLT